MPIKDLKGQNIYSFFLSWLNPTKFGLNVHTFLDGLLFTKSFTRVSHPRHHCGKDTWRSLCPADQVEAGSYDVCHLSPSCQVLAHNHLEEIKGRIQAVLVQLQLAAEVVYLPFP